MDQQYRRNSLKTWLEDLGVLYLGAIALVLALSVVGWSSLSTSKAAFAAGSKFPFGPSFTLLGARTPWANPPL